MSFSYLSVYQGRGFAFSSLVLGLFGIEGTGRLQKVLPVPSQKFLAFDLYELDAVFTLSEGSGLNLPGLLPSFSMREE